MNVKTAKKAKKRIDISYVQRFKMKAYGYNNLYPQDLCAISSASGTTELCISRYAKFIEGYGFDSSIISDCVVNRLGETSDDILHNVAYDLARYGGFALHVNYNVLCEVSEINFIPFEQCRLEEDDDAGHISHILIHEDWTGRTTRNGKRLLVNEKNIKRINVFNPDKQVVAQEIQNAGGIECYDGQILYISKDGIMTYPTPIYDAIVSEASTDEGLSNVKYRNVRNNFLVSCMLITKKGVAKIDENGDTIDNGEMIKSDDLVDFQGDENTGKIMLVELENNEDAPSVVAFPTKNFDKEFSVTETTTIERIYAQFHQELFYAIRMGKLGFSGQVMQDAYEYYAGEVTTEQRLIERAFSKIFAVWVNKGLQNENFILQPLKYISSDSNNTIDNE